MSKVKEVATTTNTTSTTTEKAYTEKAYKVGEYVKLSYSYGDPILLTKDNVVITFGLHQNDKGYTKVKLSYNKIPSILLNNEEVAK